MPGRPALEPEGRLKGEAVDSNPGGREKLQLTGADPGDVVGGEVGETDILPGQPGVVEGQPLGGQDLKERVSPWRPSLLRRKSRESKPTLRPHCPSTKGRVLPF